MTDESDEYDLTLAEAARVIDRQAQTVTEWVEAGRPGLGELPTRETADGQLFRLQDLIAFARPDVPPKQRRHAADLASARAAGMRAGRQLKQLSKEQLDIVRMVFGRPAAPLPSITEDVTRSTGQPKTGTGSRSDISDKKRTTPMTDDSNCVTSPVADPLPSSLSDRVVAITLSYPDADLLADLLVRIEGRYWELLEDIDLHKVTHLLTVVSDAIDGAQS